jgi:hypothetical protein
MAMQWAVRVNEAYQRLKDPLSRAAYLCELRGVPVRPSATPPCRRPFLMQQMQWREALEEAAIRSSEVAALDEQVQRDESRDEAALDGLAGRRGTNRRPRGPGAGADVRGRFRHDIERRLDSAASRPDRPRTAHGPAADLRTRAGARTRTSGASPSASTWAPHTRWWPPCATAWPNACPTPGACAAAVGRALPGRRPAPDRRRRACRAGRGCREHHRLGQALHGPPCCADLHGLDKLPYRFVDLPGMVGLATREGVKSPVEVSAEILASLRQRAEDTFDDELLAP